MSVKEGLFDGKIVQRAPEFDDCREISKKHNVPLKKVYEQVWKSLNKHHDQETE